MTSAQASPDGVDRIAILDAKLSRIRKVLVGLILFVVLLFIAVIHVAFRSTLTLEHLRIQRAPNSGWMDLSIASDNLPSMGMYDQGAALRVLLEASPSGESALLLRGGKWGGVLLHARADERSSVSVEGKGGGEAILTTKPGEPGALYLLGPSHELLFKAPESAPFPPK
jgi:hypothetical protein